MKDSTVDDIVSNYNALLSEAKQLLAEWDNVRASNGDDYWESVSIGDYQFDINVFDWNTEDGEPMTVATAHPVSWDADGYGSADMSNFVRLATKTSVIKEVGIR